MEHGKELLYLAFAVTLFLTGIFLAVRVENEVRQTADFVSQSIYENHLYQIR
ncbi:hypothetical protein [Anaerolentibacter hominis]|uniref:hypothetical protein n=1 Tax=Anaerolentibacter hominis TaxID=3079009 RepID=UPI0031B86EC5